MSTAATTAALLTCNGVTKAYGGLVAVRDVTLRVPPGSIFAIVGPNGAGKTTLFEVIAGASPPTAGSIAFDGKDITGMPGDKICRRGLSRTFQTAIAFQSLSILGNALIGAQYGRADQRSLAFGFSDDTIERAQEALALCGLADTGRRAAGLSVIDTKRLMIATAVAAEAKMMLLDEPVGGLTVSERGELIDLVRVLQGRGMTFLMIEHVMGVVRELADEVLVLDHGEEIAVGTPSEVLANELVQSVYLGKPSRSATRPSSEAR